MGGKKDELTVVIKLQQRYIRLGETGRLLERKRKDWKRQKGFWGGKKKLWSDRKLLGRKERIRRSKERRDCYYGVRLSLALREAPQELRSSRDKNTPASARHSANHNLGSDAGTRSGPNMSPRLGWEICYVLARFIQIGLLL